MNQPFTNRQKFCHVYASGQRMILSVDKTQHEMRFRFQWLPPLKSRYDLEEILEEFIQWRDFWLGGEFGPKHGVQDFMLLMSCESEISNLESQLP